MSASPPIADVVVIGGGPAGLTAAMYLSRAQKRVVVVDNGRSYLAKTDRIENYFGIEHISGAELLEKGRQQARRFGAHLVDAEAVGITLIDTGFRVATTNGTFEGKKLILATGSQPKTPAIKDLEKFVGKGVSYCVVCDGFFFKNKPVVVLGHGNFAAHEALELTRYTPHVSIYTHGEQPQMGKEFYDRLISANIRIHFDRVVAIRGETSVEGIELANGSIVPCAGVFVALGTGGAIDFARMLGLELVDNRFIKVDEYQRTNFPGVYAAGDCTGHFSQVATAVGQGATAALTILSEEKGTHVRDYH